MDMRLPRLNHNVSYQVARSGNRNEDFVYEVSAKYGVQFRNRTEDGVPKNIIG